MKAVALSLLLAAAPLAHALPQDLARALDEYYQAEMRNDIAALNGLLADDYLVVNSDASVEDKQKTLANFRAPGFKVDPYVIEERVERVWDNAAIITGLVRLRWTQGGEHRTRLLRMTYVWAKRDGRWQATFTQVTRVPSSRQAAWLTTLRRTAAAAMSPRQRLPSRSRSSTKD